VSFQFLTQRTLPIFFLCLSFCVSLRLSLSSALPFAVFPVALNFALAWHTMSAH
jgi:hypothetical protein